MYRHVVEISCSVCDMIWEEEFISDADGLSGMLYDTILHAYKEHCSKEHVIKLPGGYSMVFKGSKEI